MKGMQILINGRKRKFIPVNKQSFPSFVMQWLLTELPSDCIFATGMQLRPDDGTKNPAIWQTDQLKPGDEITIKLVDGPKSRPPTKKPQKRPLNR